MREILFRGKLTERFAKAAEMRPDLVAKGIIKDGFVCGSLAVDCGKCHICTSVYAWNGCYVSNSDATMFEVEPNTVGQFTGLIDKNGKKIFEGDIVKSSRFNKIEEVRYTNKRKRIMFCGINYIVDLEYINEIYYEVIGNIYDNPELLEDGEEDD